MRTHRRDTFGNATHARLRGMPRDGIVVGAPETVQDVRSRRLLRRLPEQTRDSALSPDSSPDHRGVRSARGLGLVLRGRGVVRSGRTDDAANRAYPAVRLIGAV